MKFIPAERDFPTTHKIVKKKKNRKRENPARRIAEYPLAAAFVASCSAPTARLSGAASLLAVWMSERLRGLYPPIGCHSQVPPAEQADEREKKEKTRTPTHTHPDMDREKQRGDSERLRKHDA